MASNRRIVTRNAAHITITPQSTRRCTYTQETRNDLLIWLDKDIDDGNADYRNIVVQLQQVVEEIRTFTNAHECIQFIQAVNNRKIWMLISGSIGQQVMPHVHNIHQVDSIFIFCGNKRRHEQWAKEWPKIKGVFTEIKSLHDALQGAVHQRDHYIASARSMTSDRRLDRLDPSFMYTRIVKEILLTIRFKHEHVQQFVDYCRRTLAGNIEVLENVDQLELYYYYRTPIWWYTRYWFLSSMLNRALRVTNMDVITRMGFFITDLHRHIEQLHKEQFAGLSAAHTFTVYRQDRLSKADFEQIADKKNGLMSFNNFVTTNKTRPISRDLASQTLANPDLVLVLFVMRIDPSQATTPFASTREADYFGKEDEVLFSMHSVFRIDDIQPMARNNRLFEIHLSLTNDDDHELRALGERIREESLPDREGWCRLGSVLIKMGEYEKAEEIYRILHGRATDEAEKATIDNQLGLIKYNQRQYPEALAFHQKALIALQKTLPSTHPNLAVSYNNVGKVYHNIGDYSKALACYEKAEIIQQRSRSPATSDLASTNNNIGAVYAALGENTKAFSSYEKALAIQRQSLPLNHPDLASTYNNIGAMYHCMSDYPKACSFYERAVQIGQQSLPSNHPHLQDYRRCLAAVEALRISSFSPRT